MSTIILIIGLTIFVSHFFAVLFRRTNIPDVLLLMVIGLVAGSVMGWVRPTDFGKVGPVIATIALVVILFESGTPLRLQEEAGTVLVLESALTDVLSIVGVFALLQVATDGDVGAGKLIGGVLASLIFAAVLGVLGGVGWLLILGKVRDFPNTISTTIAYAFLIYGFSEFLAPNDLAAAVLASLPLQYGVPEGAMIRDTAYMVVLVSITLCAVLVMGYSARPVQSLYAMLLGKPRSQATANTQQP